jgi:hypothetical protein
MPLKEAPAPAKAWLAVREQIASLGWRPEELRTRAHREAQGGAPSEARPVFQLSADAAGKGLSGARQIGWRFGLDADGDHSAEVHMRPGARPRVAHLNTGSQFAGATAQLRQLEAWDEVREGTFVVRLLRVPGLALRAIWLRSPRGVKDIVIPLAPVHRPFEAGRRYGPREFTSLVQRQFETMLPTMDATLPGGSRPKRRPASREPRKPTRRKTKRGG